MNTVEYRLDLRDSLARQAEAPAMIQDIVDNGDDLEVWATFPANLIAWRSDLLRTVVEANDEQDAANKVGEALGEVKVPRNTVSSLELNDGQIVQVTYDRELADEIDVKTESTLNLNAESENVWDSLVEKVEAMFNSRKSSSNFMSTRTPQGRSYPHSAVRYGGSDRREVQIWSISLFCAATLRSLPSARRNSGAAVPDAVCIRPSRRCPYRERGCASQERPSLSGRGVAAHESGSQKRQRRSS